MRLSGEGWPTEASLNAKHRDENGYDGSYIRSQNGNIPYRIAFAQVYNPDTYSISTNT